MIDMKRRGMSYLHTHLYIHRWWWSPSHFCHKCIIVGTKWGIFSNDPLFFSCKLFQYPDINVYVIAPAENGYTIVDGRRQDAIQYTDQEILTKLSIDRLTVLNSRQVGLLGSPKKWRL